MFKHVPRSSLILLALSLISCYHPAEPILCTPGEPIVIDTHVIWSPDANPGIIGRDILVTPRGTLEILAGTEIRFHPRSVTECDPSGRYKRNPRLDVEGSLIVRGTESRMVSFEPRDGGDDEFGPVSLVEDGSAGGECFIEWASFEWVRVAGYSPVIRFCELKKLELRDSENVEIAGNTAGSIFALCCEGVITENIVGACIYLRDDSLVVLRNRISVPGPEWDSPGIVSAGSSRAYIAENCLHGCRVGVEIFSGSPKISFNDFIDCGINITVRPFIDSAEADTIDARYNWWGSTDESVIESKIVYLENRFTVSEKVIRTDPFETGPLVVCW